MTETEADIVPELRAGMYLWFADDTAEGFRKIAYVEPWVPEHGTFEAGLARDWVTVTYTDGHVDNRVRYGTHEIWKSGPRSMVGAA